jgi:hypothetical protein
MSWCWAHSGLVIRNYFPSEGFWRKISFSSLWDDLSDERPSLSFVNYNTRHSVWEVLITRHNSMNWLQDTGHVEDITAHYVETLLYIVSVVKYYKYLQKRNVDNANRLKHWSVCSDTRIVRFTEPKNKYFRQGSESEFLAAERRCIVSCEVRTEFIYVMYKKVDRLCGLVVSVPGYTTEMYCASCKVRTEFIYVM